MWFRCRSTRITPPFCCTERTSPLISFTGWVASLCVRLIRFDGLVAAPSKGGMLIGDDYVPSYQGVVPAFDDFFGEKNIPITSDAGKCQVRKP